MSLTISLADGLIIVVYLAAVFSFGIYMSRREKTPGDFFLAGRRLPWYAIALSLFASNISSISLIGLSGDWGPPGAQLGLARTSGGAPGRTKWCALAHHANLTRGGATEVQQSNLSERTGVY